MYPHHELIRLAAHKAALRRKIALSRVQCTEAAVRVTRPLVWLDRAAAIVRQLSPLAILAAVPAGLIVQRTLAPRLRLLGTVIRWAPPLFAIVRGLRATQVQAAPASPKSKST